MRIVNPRGVISGFHADLPGPELPQLLHVGEQWVASDFTISEHSHPVWEFYLQLEGWSLWSDETGAEFECPPGAFYAPPPGRVHWLSRMNPGGHHFLYGAIDVGAIARLRLPELHGLWDESRAAHSLAGASCEPAFRQVIREATIPRALRASALAAALDVLVVEASRLLVEHTLPGGQTEPPHPAVAQAKRAMEAHPGEPWRLADLGRLTGMSPNHLAWLFARQVGVPPHRHLQLVRMARARALLLEGALTITEIAHQLGFHSSQHFARAFRMANGCSAGEFRRQAGR